MRRAGRWVAVALGVVVAVWMLARGAGIWVAELTRWVQGMGPLAPAAFVAAYGVSTVALVPASVLTVAAGVLFGVVRGTAYAFLGATLGAALTFLLARYGARRAVKRRLARDARFVRIDRAISRNGFQVVFLLRLSPILPFALVNYALGVTRVRFVDYFVASVGLLPPTWLYVYNGTLMGEVTGMRVSRIVGAGAGGYAVVALGLLATAGVTLLLARLTRRALL